MSNYSPQLAAGSFTFSASVSLKMQFHKDTFRIRPKIGRPSRPINGEVVESDKVAVVSLFKIERRVYLHQFKHPHHSAAVYQLLSVALPEWREIKRRLEPIQL